MRIGAAIPQREIASDPAALAGFVRGAEELGYSHVLVFDHVVGAARTTRPDWDGRYDLSDPFHEPFTLLSWIAAQTHALELVTGVLVLPQRQTVLVGKQAAELDRLSGGRLRLGVGVGWNAVEYEALGIPFSSRGRRIEEQIHLLRRLWTEPHVTFEGRWDRIDSAGLNPGSVQRPIPIWIGGAADAVVERAASLADGWMPMLAPDEAISRLMRNPRASARWQTPDRRPLGLEGRVTLRNLHRDDWAAQLRRWQAVGATHATVNTSGLGLRNHEAHLAVLGDLRRQTRGEVDWQTARGPRVPEPD